MKALLTITMAALLLTCGTAQASDWVSLGKNNAGTFEQFIDVSSIRIEGNIRRAWVKSVFKAHTKTTTPNDRRYWEHSIAKNAFNCAQEMTRTEALAVYFEDGTNFQMPAESYPSPWEPVVPDTVDAYNMKFICRWKP